MTDQTNIVIREPAQASVALWDTDESKLILKNMIFKDSTDEEFMCLIMMARIRNLDPWKKQITAIKIWDNKANRYNVVPIVTIDGLRSIAMRSGLYAGQDKPIFDYDRSNPNYPTRCEVTVYRIVGGMRCPFTGEATWKEFYPGEKRGQVWLRMPRVMLGKCSEAAALRKSFPDDCGGLYEESEADIMLSSHRKDDLNELNHKLLGKSIVAKIEPAESQTQAQLHGQEANENINDAIDYDVVPPDAGDAYEKTESIDAGVANYIIPSGSLKGKVLSSIDISVLRKYADELEMYIGDLKASNKPISNAVKNTYKNICLYISSVE